MSSNFTEAIDGTAAEPMQPHHYQDFPWRRSVATPPSSLEDHVRLLCQGDIAAKTQSELDAILPELKAAIREHSRYLRAIALEAIPEAFGLDGTLPRKHGSKL